MGRWEHARKQQVNAWLRNWMNQIGHKVQWHNLVKGKKPSEKTGGISHAHGRTIHNYSVEKEKRNNCSMQRMQKFSENYPFSKSRKERRKNTFVKRTPQSNFLKPATGTRPRQINFASYEHHQGGVVELKLDIHWQFIMGETNWYRGPFGTITYLRPTNHFSGSLFAKQYFLIILKPSDQYLTSHCSENWGEELKAQTYEQEAECIPSINNLIKA